MGDGFTDHGSLQPEQIVLPNGSSLIPQWATVPVRLRNQSTPIGEARLLRHSGA
jgi:hypothetical protein